MSGPFGSSQWMYSSGGGFYPYEIDQSLRFETSYLNRIASAGNRKTWTWSGWIKREQPTSGTVPHCVFSTENNGGIFEARFDGNTPETFQIGDQNQNYFVTSALYRDFSAWMHLVIRYDTTQATASNRVRIYINGTQVTSFASANYPSQNFDSSVNNSGTNHFIGKGWTGGANYKGYMAEINFIDGQALDPTSFGEFKSGVWVAKSYSGSYGTNGFHLDFSNSGSLGADSSGNGNNWTVNNLAATDQVLDSPTNNFATMNPNDDWVNTVLSEGNLKVGTNSTYGIAKGGFWMTSGKWYWEFTPLNMGAYYPNIGVRFNEATGSIGGSSAEDVTYWPNGQKYISGALTAYGSSYTTGDVIGAALDMDSATKTITFYKNGVSQGPITLPANQYTANINVASGAGGGGTLAVVNFGQDSSFAGNKTAQGNTDDNGVGDFYYAPPSGYLALCTANLPDPAIDPAQDDVPADYFNTVLYTGNGSTQSITGVGFQPDWVWIKERNGSSDHVSYDIVRGATKRLRQNISNAEDTVANSLTSFNTDGFSLGSDASVNESSSFTYASWNWKAGGSAVTNTDGSITTSVSASPESGFSVLTYTGNGSNSTLGHGLNKKPSMIICKKRSGGASWRVYHEVLGATQRIYLDETGAAAASSIVWNNTEPTSSVFTIGTDSAINQSGATFVSYVFAEVDGFSKFGSYTGNGSSDGPFVYTGFRPAFVIVKKTNSSGEWVMWDDKRSGYNVDNDFLYPAGSNTEFNGSTYVRLDLVSNGFKMRDNSADTNGSGNTYIYIAFAQNPFKYANAR